MSNIINIDVEVTKTYKVQKMYSINRLKVRTQNTLIGTWWPIKKTYMKKCTVYNNRKGYKFYGGRGRGIKAYRVNIHKNSTTMAVSVKPK